MELLSLIIITLLIIFLIYTIKGMIICFKKNALVSCLFLIFFAFPLVIWSWYELLNQKKVNQSDE